MISDVLCEAVDDIREGYPDDVAASPEVQIVLTFMDALRQARDIPPSDRNVPGIDALLAKIYELASVADELRRLQSVLPCRHGYESRPLTD